MKFPLLMTRTLRIPAAVVVTVVAVSFTYPGGLAAAVEDFQNYGRFHHEMDTARDRDAELDTHSVGLFDRIATKQAIIHEVFAGRVTLADAADRFLTLTADDTQAMDFLRARYDGSTDLERMARNVIEHAKAQRDDSNHKAVVAHLDRQFRARFGHPR